MSSAAFNRRGSSIEITLPSNRHTQPTSMSKCSSDKHFLKMLPVVITIVVASTVIGLTTFFVLNNQQGSEKNIGCEPIVAPEHAIVDFPQGRLSTAMFHCEVGYVSTGPTVKICSTEGVWLPSDSLQCLLRDCGPPDVLENMHYKLTNSTRFGNEAFFDCSPGYAIQGPERKRCYDTGIWEPNELNECIPYECGELVHPDNGYIVSNGTSFGSHLLYVCYRGYEIQGPTTLRCNETGHWFPEEDTLCISKSLTEDPCHNMTLQLLGNLTQRQVGYNSSGSESMLCDRTLDNGWYSMEDFVITTSTKGCGTTTSWYRVDELPIDTNVTKDIKVCSDSCSSSLDVKCLRCGDGTYIFQLKHLETCFSAYCIEKTSTDHIECDILNPIAHGNLDYSASVNYNSTVTFTCDFGYNLKGPSNKTCDEFGIWQPRDSVDCIVVECPSSDNLANGLIYTTNGNRYGSIITHTCNRGYVAVPFSSQTCTGNGFWKPSGVASCRAKDCAEIIPPSFGFVNYTDGTNLGSVATVSCLKGYKQSRKSTQICEDPGNWVLLQGTRCEPINCSSLNTILNGEITVNGTVFGSTAHFSCNTGYRRYGPEYMQCSEFGTWIPNETTMCILGFSGAPNISHMHATINTGLRKNGNESEVELYCELENQTSDNYYFTVSWGLSENSIWNEIVLISNPTVWDNEENFRRLTALTSSKLIEKGIKSWGFSISCQVTARYNPWSDEGPPIFSNEKFCGIKVHNESLNIYNSEIDTLYVELTVPFKCWMSVPACTIELKMIFNDTTDSCEIPGAARTYLYEANRRQKEDVGELKIVYPQGTLSLRCGISLSEKDVGKLRRFHVVSRPGSVSYPMEVLISMHLSINGNFESDGLFQNYTPNAVQVHVSTDYSKLQNKICYSHNDPHMKTFDGLSFENHNPGIFTLYRNTEYRQMVQIQTALCYGGHSTSAVHVPVFCNCGVVVNAGRDVFVANLCAPNKVLDIGFRTCHDGILEGRVKKLSNVRFQVHLPTGTIVEISFQENFLNVDIYPSMYDYEQTEGLCAYFDGNIDNDVSSHLESNNINTTAALAWRIPQNESLFDSDNDDKLLPWEDPLRTCTCNNEVEKCEGPISKICKFEPVFNDACTNKIYRRSTTHSHMLSFRSKQFQNQGPVHPRRYKRNLKAFTSIDYLHAREMCMSILNATVFRKCASVPGLDFLSEIEDCVLDTQATNSLQWASVHLEAIQNRCVQEIKAKTIPKTEVLKSATIWINQTSYTNASHDSIVDEASKQANAFKESILSIACPNSCSGVGICEYGTCHCVDGYIGEDCGTLRNQVPSLKGVQNDGVCDINGGDCSSISLFSYNLADTELLTCKYNFLKVTQMGIFPTSYSEVTVRATMVTYEEVKCELKSMPIHDNVTGFDDEGMVIAFGYQVSISNDAVSYSRQESIVAFDSHCIEVDSQGKPSGIKDGYCTIDAICYNENDEYGCMRCERMGKKVQWREINDCIDSTTQTAYSKDENARDLLKIVLAVVGTICTIITTVMTIVLTCCEASKKKDESLNSKTDAKVKDEPNTEHMKLEPDQHSNDITQEPDLDTTFTTTKRDNNANDIQSEGDRHLNGNQSEPEHDTNGKQSESDHVTKGIQSEPDQETNDIAPEPDLDTNVITLELNQDTNDITTEPEQDTNYMTSNHHMDMNNIKSESDKRSYAKRHWKIIAIAFGLLSAAVFVALIVVYVTDKGGSSSTPTDGLIKATTAETKPTSTTISLQTTTTETTTIMQTGRAVTGWIIPTIVCGTAVLIYISVFIYCLCRTRE